MKICRQIFKTVLKKNLIARKSTSHRIIISWVLIQEKNSSRRYLNNIARLEAVTCEANVRADEATRRRGGIEGTRKCEKRVKNWERKDSQTFERWKKQREDKACGGSAGCRVKDDDQIRFIYDLSIYEFKATTVNHGCYFEWSFSTYVSRIHIYISERRTSLKQAAICNRVASAWKVFVQDGKERETRGRMKEEEKRNEIKTMKKMKK